MTPTDHQIQTLLDMRFKNVSLTKCFKAIGIKPPTYYDWIEHGASDDPNVHVKHPQARKLFLALKEIGKSEVKKKLHRQEVMVPKKNIFEGIFHDVVEQVQSEEKSNRAKFLLRKLLGLVSTKMADGSQATGFCDYCQMTGVHNGATSCQCVCHEVRSFLG